MKTFNKILAMVLAVLTVLVMLPVSAFADAWLDVDSQTEATSSTVTVKVDAKKLAAILQENGISKALLKEVLADASIDKAALLQAFSVEELFEIIPKQDIAELIDIPGLLDQIGVDALVGYLDFEALLSAQEPEDVIALIPEEEIKDVVDVEGLKLEAQKKLEESVKPEDLEHLAIPDFETSTDAINYAISLGVNVMEYVDFGALVTAVVEGGALREIVSMIGAKNILAQLDVNEIKEIVDAVDVRSYVKEGALLLGSKLLTNIDQITVDGMLVAGENDVTAMLEIYPTNLAKAVLKMIPTLNDIANIQNNVVFSTTVGLTYTADENAATNAGKTKTKNITFELVLEGNLEPVKAAAAKLQAFLATYIDFDVTDNGDIYLGVDLPTVSTPAVFTEIFNKVLDTEKLSEDTKLKLLNLVNVDGKDVVGYMDTITFEDLITILEAVEPTALYEAFCNISYVQTVIDKVSEKIGYDLGNVSLDDMKYCIANVPSIERICEIIENRTGRDVLAILEAAANKVDGLTGDARVAKLLDIVEEKIGRDLDISVAEVLDRAKDAPISETIAEIVAERIGVNVRDALNSYTVDELWAIAVEKAAAHEGAYNKVKNYALALADLLPEAIMDTCIADFYAGNGVFTFDKTVSVSDKALVSKLLPKLFTAVKEADVLVEAVCNKLGVDVAILDAIMAKIDNAADLVLTDELLNKLIAVTPDATITGSLSFGVQVTDVYQITYMDKEGDTVLFSAFLPVGAELDIFKTDSTISGYDIADWTDAEGNPVLTMPAEDTVVYADRNAVEVTFVDVDGKTVLGSYILKSGDLLTEEILDAVTEMVSVGTYNEKIHKGYTISWLNADGEAADPTTPITANVTFVADVALESILDYDGDFTLEYIDGLYKLTLHGQLPAELTLDLARDYILADAAADAKANMQIWIDNGTDSLADDYNFVALDNATLAEFYNNRSADGDAVAFGYKALNSVANDLYKNNKDAAFHNFDILVNGEATEGSFGGKLTIKLPYDKAITATADKATRVNVVTANGRENVEATVTRGFVAFDAPHFSQFVITNEYKLNVVFVDTDGNNVAGGLSNSDYAYLPEGAVVALKDLYEYYGKLTQKSVAASVGTVSNGKLTMPAEAVTVTVTFYAKQDPPVIPTTPTHNVYYYVNGVLYETVTYEDGTVPKWINISTVIADTGVKVPVGFVKTGAEWLGVPTDDAIKANPADVYIFAKWTLDTYTVNFVAGDNTQTLTYNIHNYKQKTAPAVPAGATGEIGRWNYSDLATELAKAFNVASKSVTITASYSKIPFTVTTDGNANVSGPTVEPGALVSVTDITEKPGYTAVVSVVDDNGNAIDLRNDGKFIMPASNVYVSVSYEANDLVWYANGVQQTGKYGSTATFTVEVAKGEILKTAPTGCELVAQTVNADGTKVLTYAFTLTTEGVNFTWEKVGNPGLPFYVMNGAFYDATVTPDVEGDVAFDKWVEGFAGMSFATFTVEKTASYLWLWILLIALAVIFLIVLIYKLYMAELLKPNFITRFVTWLVSLFFGLCLGISAIVCLFRKSDDPADYGMAPAEEKADEEATEEAAEEATEEAAEEATEEAAEEATEEAAEEATEEAAEEATEEVAEEATEEAAEEATEEDETKRQ